MNILAIPDLHIPFEDNRAFAFVRRLIEEKKIDRVIFLGDIVDNHALSYHESDPDGMSAGTELDEAIETLKRWYELLPFADVCIGNHDSLPKRKAFTSGMPSRWIKSYAEVLGVPNWDFQPYHEEGKWFFSHGIGQLVHSRAKDMNRHCVAGHVHSKAEIRWENGLWSAFGGCLVNDDSYAMAYGKWGKKGKKGCIVIEDANEENAKMYFVELKDERWCYD